MVEAHTEAASPANGAREKKPRPEWVKALIPGLLVAVICGVFASAFLWPMSQMEPKDISIAITGPDEQVAQLEDSLTAQQDDLFVFTEYADRDAAVQAIEAREVLGGVVVGQEGTEFLTASAGNAQVTQMLGQVAAGMERAVAAQGAQGVADAVQAAKDQGLPAEQILAVQEQAQQRASSVSVTVTDVVSGGGNAFAGNLTMLPALIGGMMGGMLSVMMVKRPSYRILTVVVGSIGVGLVGAAVLGPWFDMIPGSYGLHALALGLGALAVSSVISGLGSLFGMGGAGLGAALVMLIGTPWGGIMMPTEFLPGAMATVGAHMPTGTVVSLMKSISYFPDATTGGQWWTLALWATVGILVILGGALLSSARDARREAPATA